MPSYCLFQYYFVVNLLTEVVDSMFKSSKISRYKGDAAQLVHLDWDAGDLMIFTTKEKQRVVSSMPKQPYTDIEKFQLLISYLFELAYDLAIRPDINLSESAGF
jgi:hypothetical protein